MRNILAFPLHIIAEENTVAKITRDYYLIIDVTGLKLRLWSILV
jgi:hypothetical protein